MVSIKFTGKGLVSRGINFSPTTNGGLYDVTDEDAKYLVATFPSWFTEIERKTEKKAEPKKRATRKKKVETPTDGEDINE